MENVSDNEQWKSGGDCTLCRRRNYCSKKCKEHKKLIDNEVAKVTGKIFSRILGGRYKG